MSLPASPEPTPQTSSVQDLQAAPAAGQLPVREGETAWTDAERDQVYTDLVDEISFMERQIDATEREIAATLRESGHGSGDDQVDLGSETFEREHELATLRNARDLLGQAQRAASRLRAGTYGNCENCGQPIGKARLQAYPRATLCVTCKAKEERR